MRDRDGGTADVGGQVEEWDGHTWGDERSLVVAVGAGDDDVELLAVLAYVSGGLLGDGGTPESTLDVGDRWWVRASSAWVDARVTLEV